MKNEQCIWNVSVKGGDLRAGQYGTVRSV